MLIFNDTNEKEEKKAQEWVEKMREKGKKK